jgi:hypothetical protein
MINHTAARRVKVAAVGFADDQGETEDSPMPDPSATSSKVIAAAASAPPTIAAHETAGAEAAFSLVITVVERAAPVASAIWEGSLPVNAKAARAG